MSDDFDLVPASLFGRSVGLEPLGRIEAEMGQLHNRIIDLKTRIAELESAIRDAGSGGR
jgi:hypothetical protein